MDVISKLELSFEIYFHKKCTKEGNDNLNENSNN